MNSESFMLALLASSVVMGSILLTRHAQKVETCSTCSGSGRVPWTASGVLPRQCPECGKANRDFSDEIDWTPRGKK